MRTLFAVVAALLGGYLLWTGIKFARVLLILEDSSFDGTMLVIAGVLAAVGAGLLFLAYRLFRVPTPPAPPPAPPAPPTA